MARLPVTACIIVCDEEDRLPDCLASLEGLCEEVVVVDGGSADRTVALAREAGARVIETDWPGHVAQKQRAVEAAKTDWVLCIDADERLSPELRDEIAAVLDSEPAAVGYSFPRLTWYLNRWIRHGGWYPDRKVRLFDRRHGHWGGIDPHDHVQIDGPVVALRGDLHHHTYRDIADHLRIIAKYTTIAAEEKRAAGERFRLRRLVFRPIGKVLRMYVLRAGFLDGLAGFVVAILGGFYVFLKYAKLWEQERREKDRAR